MQCYYLLVVENTDYSNKNSGILLSRNAPVALVVGVGGFLGSFLAEELLNKGIQVIGVDNFSNGRRDDLEEAVKNKNFHLFAQSTENLNLDLSRLDYLFIIPEREFGTNSILRIFKEKNCRLLFVSSIDLYSAEISSDLKWLKAMEERVAKFAHENHLNARILRLGTVIGPRMNFKNADPAVKLIQSALNDQLQKNIPMEFSTRALYITDAIDLIIKSMLAGATAQKIFDGVLPIPIQVAEVKQVLLDPIWYENKNFVPTELPPWKTPNLDKTIKFLNWMPKAGLVTSLKETLHYFKDKGIDVPKIEEREQVSVRAQEQSWKEEKKDQLEGLKLDNEKGEGEKKKQLTHFKFKKIPWNYFYSIAVIILITYSLIWPIFSFGVGVFISQYNLSRAFESLQKGDLDGSFVFIKQTRDGVEEMRSVVDSFSLLRQAPFLNDKFQLTDDVLAIIDTTTNIAQSVASATQSLYEGLKAVTGEINQPSKDFFDKSQLEFASAAENLARFQTKLKDEKFIGSFPGLIQDRLNNLKNRLVFYEGLVEKGRAASILLPDIAALNGSKNYLILLQNNAELRAGGGFIGSIAKISFENGKLKKIDANDVYAIDGQLTNHVEPPKEIKEDLGQKDWYLRDSNWEPDFPTSARQSEWFYTKETGESVQGVIAMDLTAAADLLATIGTLDLADYNEKISSDNLFEKAVTHAESGFFPGSQAKKSFLTALVTQLFNKLFFLPRQNWPGIVASLGKSLDEKHISIYLNDTKLFSYLVAQNWTNVLPRPSDLKEGYYSDLLAPV